MIIGSIRQRPKNVNKFAKYPLTFVMLLTSLSYGFKLTHIQLLLVPALLHVPPVPRHLQVLPLRAHQPTEEPLLQLFYQFRLLLRHVVRGGIQVLESKSSDINLQYKFLMNKSFLLPTLTASWS